MTLEASQQTCCTGCCTAALSVIAGQIMYAGEFSDVLSYWLLLCISQWLKMDINLLNTKIVYHKCTHMVCSEIRIQIEYKEILSSNSPFIVIWVLWPLVEGHKHSARHYWTRLLLKIDVQVPSFEGNRVQEDSTWAQSLSVCTQGKFSPFFSSPKSSRFQSRQSLMVKTWKKPDLFSNNRDFKPTRMHSDDLFQRRFA